MNALDSTLADQLAAKLGAERERAFTAEKHKAALIEDVKRLTRERDAAVHDAQVATESWRKCGEIFDKIPDATDDPDWVNLERLWKQRDSYKSAVDQAHAAIDQSGVLPPRATSHDGLPERISEIFFYLAGQRTRANDLAARLNSAESRLVTEKARADAAERQLDDLLDQPRPLREVTFQELAEKQRQIDALATQVATLRAAAEDFVAKVERGETHSVRSYAKFKAALAPMPESTGKDMPGLLQFKFSSPTPATLVLPRGEHDIRMVTAKELSALRAACDGILNSFAYAPGRGPAWYEACRTARST